jgi:hypothetical protein
MIVTPNLEEYNRINELRPHDTQCFILFRGDGVPMYFAINNTMLPVEWNGENQRWDLCTAQRCDQIRDLLPALVENPSRVVYFKENNK